MKLTLKRNSRPRWYVHLDVNSGYFDGDSWSTIRTKVWQICHPNEIEYRTSLTPWGVHVAFYRKVDAVLFMLKVGA